MVDTLLKRPLKVRETLCRTAKLHLFADVVPSLSTTAAGVTGNAHFDGDAVTDLEVTVLTRRSPDGLDDAGRFVAECERLADQDVAVAVVVVVVQIRAA